VGVWDLLIGHPRLPGVWVAVVAASGVAVCLVPFPCWRALGRGCPAEGRGQVASRLQFACRRVPVAVGPAILLLGLIAWGPPSSKFQPAMEVNRSLVCLGFRFHACPDRGRVSPPAHPKSRQAAGQLFTSCLRSKIHLYLGRSHRSLQIVIVLFAARFSPPLSHHFVRLQGTATAGKFLFFSLALPPQQIIAAIASPHWAFSALSVRHLPAFLADHRGRAGAISSGSGGKIKRPMSVLIIVKFRSSSSSNNQTSVHQLLLRHRRLLSRCSGRCTLVQAKTRPSKPWTIPQLLCKLFFFSFLVVGGHSQTPFIPSHLFIYLVGGLCCSQPVIWPYQGARRSTACELAAGNAFGDSWMS